MVVAGFLRYARNLGKTFLPMYPFLRLNPIYQTRVWGGRSLATQLKRKLPDAESPFGESWDISARSEADCVVNGGSLAGKTLTQVWKDRDLHDEIFGPSAPDQERFPLLCKVLDAHDKLSIQVHPPTSVAKELGGEAKTEMWYIAHADPGALLYVGLKNGIGKEEFETSLKNGTLEDCVHAIEAKTGEHIFIPSGRLHAIGGGLLIYEIQQNSDSTYRVYDWNRLGMNGKPRDLHVEESLRCIDFDDIEPEMDKAEGNIITQCEHFQVEKHDLSEGESLDVVSDGRFAIVTVVKGELKSKSRVEFSEGDFFIVPHGPESTDLVAGDAPTELLITTWPQNG